MLKTKIHNTKERNNTGKTGALVCVQDKNGKPLMPTSRCGHVRWLLKTGKAKVVQSKPFTIRLTYDTPGGVQPCTLGIDPGRENIGLAAVTPKGECVFQAEVETHNRSIKKNMAGRAASRGGRRQHERQKRQRKALRKGLAIKAGQTAEFQGKKVSVRVTSYPGAKGTTEQKVIRGKEARFANRRREAGWLTPSGRQLLQMHEEAVSKVLEILPAGEIVLERNVFDFQQLENVFIRNREYQKGPLCGFSSYQDYISHKQKGRCLLCGKPIEHYHHIVPQSKGGADSPANIAGLCRKCHAKVHQGGEAKAALEKKVQGLKKKYKVSLLNSVIPALCEKLQELCTRQHITLRFTDGLMTGSVRKAQGLAKSHCHDALIIAMAGRTFPVQLKAPQVFLYNRFKKKNGGIIIRNHSRKYYNGKKLVAVNRRKAFEQQEPSLGGLYDRVRHDSYCQRMVETSELPQSSAGQARIYLSEERKDKSCGQRCSD